MKSNGFVINETKKNYKTKRIVAISLICLCLSIIIYIPIQQYKTAPKTAENAVAIYLTKKYNPNRTNSDKFMSFDEIYYTIKFDRSKYIIELSGSANAGISGKFDCDFYAKVTISLFSNDTKIEKLTFNNKKIVK